MHRAANLPVFKPSDKQIIGIDGLRVFSAGLVLSVHLGLAAWVPSRNGGVQVTKAFNGLNPWICYGWIGVQIFFVISGFVIAYSAQTVSAQMFARQRFLRLYPIAFITATLCLLAVEYALSSNWPQLRIFAAYVRTITFDPVGELIEDSFWTLSVEVCFYLLVYVLILTKCLRWLTAVMSVIGSLSALFWLSVTVAPYWSGTVSRLSLRICNQVAGRNYTLIPHGCYFAIGVLLWDCLMRRVDWKRILAISICVLAAILEIRMKAIDNESYLGVAFPWQMAVAIWLLAVSVIVVSTKRNVSVRNALGERGSKAFRVMGLITYPLYLLHYRIGTVLILSMAPAVGFRLAFTVAVLCLVSVAYVLAVHIDPQIRLFLRRKYAC